MNPTSYDANPSKAFGFEPPNKVWIETLEYLSVQGENEVLIQSQGGSRLFAVNGFNNSGTDYYFQVHDASAIPLDGVVPKHSMVAFSKQNFNFDRIWKPRKLQYGLYVCMSTTPFVKTVVSDSKCWFEIDWLPCGI